MSVAPPEIALRTLEAELLMVLLVTVWLARICSRSGVAAEKELATGSNALKSATTFGQSGSIPWRYLLPETRFFPREVPCPTSAVESAVRAASS